ncbi:RDD family protein [uncultured Jatrophihabitans sp.]|uniref:RDD family protein n=1 Tax=uncultured Jatrophihabitans sp. TaxID=1610747 RepID=UPI0035C9CB8A
MQPDSALISGEGVRLDLTRAGIGSRTIAAAIDAVLQFLVLTVVLLLDVAVIGSSDDAAVAAVLLVETVLVLAGYPIVAEWTTRGRTVGKACMGLRVVRDDGGPIGFRHALVRGLAGLVLEKPGLLFPLSTIAGVFTTALSTSEKRIGDMMAGTVVLNERAGRQNLGIAPLWVPPPLQPWAMTLDLHRLDDALALRLRQFVSRANGFTSAAQFALGEDLRRRVQAVVAPPPPPDAPTPFVLSAVLVERRRRAEQLVPPPAYQRPAPSAASSFAAPH